MPDQKCEDRVDSEMQSELATLRNLWKTYQEEGPEAYNEDENGRLDEHGLCFDYVTPGTFKDLREGYFRYQISTGGPGDEFRIFANGQGDRWVIYRIEYWFLDWFDGAHRILTGDDFKFMEELLMSYFMEAGSFQYEYDKAMADFDPSDLYEKEDDEDE
jgi:hypothetical protein